MKTKNLFYKLSIFLSIILILGCSSDTSENFDQELNIEEQLNLQDPVVNILINMGFNVENIIELDDFYLVNGDRIFSKDLEDYKSIQEPDFVAPQAHTDGLVSQNNVDDITVYIDPSIPTFGTDNWRNATDFAINQLNNIQGSILNLSLVTSSSLADIIVRSDFGSLPNNVIAASANFFPIGGQPADLIIINLDFFSNLNVPENVKQRNMVHEFGHTIGLRHTNWQQRGENANPFGANQIPGTPTSDPNSVMNGGTALTPWNGFSNFDVIAIEYLYPTPLVVTGPPPAFTTDPDPTICTNVFVQPTPYALPVSPGADTYQLTSNSPNLYVDTFVQPGVPITMITNQPGNYTVTLTTSNQFGSSTATIFVTATSCGGGGFGF